MLMALGRMRFMKRNEPMQPLLLRVLGQYAVALTNAINDGIDCEPGCLRQEYPESAARQYRYSWGGATRQDCLARAQSVRRVEEKLGLNTSSDYQLNAVRASNIIAQLVTSKSMETCVRRS